MSCLEKNGATLSLTSSITTNYSLFPCHTLQCLQPSRQNPPSKWLANEQVVYKYLNHIANMPEMSVARGACNYAALIKSLNAAQKPDGRRAGQIMLQCPTGPTVCFLYRLWAVVLQPQKIVKAQLRLRKQATESTDPDSMGFIKTVSEWSQEFLETRRSTRSRTCTTAIFLATQDRSPREIKTTQLLRWMRRTPFATCTGLLQTNAYSRLRLSKNLSSPPKEFQRQVHVRGLA